MLAVVKIKIVADPGTRPCLVGRDRLGEFRDMVSRIAKWRERQTQRLKRVIRIDMETCRHCGGTVS